MRQTRTRYVFSMLFSNFVDILKIAVNVGLIIFNAGVCVLCNAVVLRWELDKEC